MTLTEFLLARLDEDEAAANLAKWPYGKEMSEAPPWPTERQWSRQLSTDEGPLLGRMSPERVLAECEAKRKVVNMAARQSGMCPPDDWPASGDMSAAAVADSGRWFLRTLATPYADHPDYQQEWKP